MKPIGGYFELELLNGKEYHQDAIRLNTGRNALELILRSRKYSKVFIPYYTCEVILEPFNKLSVNYEFYSIDKNLEPIFDYTRVRADKGFLYTNYFGLKNSFVNKLSDQCKNLIIDNSQAFYSKPAKGVDTFYSARKFFGVPDGAYLYMEGSDVTDLPIDVSVDRFMHLIKRIEFGPKAGYNDFKKNDQNLIGQPIMQMSNLTRRLLLSIDYLNAKKKRRNNYLILHDALAKYNELSISIDAACTPMVYPFLIDKPDLRQRLIDEKIYIATYWPNVLKWADKTSIEVDLAKKVLALPIDHRYSHKNMNQLLNILKVIL